MNADFLMFISNFDLFFVYYGNQIDLFGMQDGVSVHWQKRRLRSPDLNTEHYPKMLSYSRHPIFSFDSFFYSAEIKETLEGKLDL